MKYSHIRLFLWRWHRRLGLAAALFLVWISISGILLNHTSELGLASKALPANLASTVSPLSTESIYTLESALGQFVLSGGWLRLQNKKIAQCESTLVGAVTLKEQIWLACSKQVLVFNSMGDLLEVMDQFFGVPVPIDRIGPCSDNPNASSKDSLCIESQTASYRFDNASSTWLAQSPPVTWNTPLSARAQLAVVPEVHNWQRFMLEAHSGRLFGRWGVLIVDLVGVISLLLAFSGCYVWWSHYRRRKLASKR